MQRSKEVVSNSLRIVHVVIRLVSFDLNLPVGQVLFLGEIQIIYYRRIVISPANQKGFWGELKWLVG